MSLNILDIDIYNTYWDYLEHYDNVKSDPNRHDKVMLYYNKTQLFIISDLEYYENNPCMDFNDSICILHFTQSTKQLSCDIISGMGDAFYDPKHNQLLLGKKRNKLFRTKYQRSLRVDTFFGIKPKRISKMNYHCFFYDRHSDKLNIVLSSSSKR